MKKYICLLIACLSVVTCDKSGTGKSNSSRFYILTERTKVRFDLEGSRIDSVVVDSFKYPNIPWGSNKSSGAAWSYDRRKIAVWISLSWPQEGMTLAIVDAETESAPWANIGNFISRCTKPWSPTDYALITQSFPYIIDTLGNAVLDSLPSTRWFMGDAITLDYLNTEWASATELYVGGRRYILQDSSLYEIYRYDFVNDTIVDRLTNNHFSETLFRVSPDGNKVAFTVLSPTSDLDYQTYYFSVNDNVLHPLGLGAEPVWTNRGEYLFYHKWNAAENRADVYLKNFADPSQAEILVPGVHVVFDAHVEME